MAEFSDFETLVAAEVLGCTVPIIEAQARKIVTDFCRETWIWSENTEVGVGEDEDRVTLSPQNNSARIIAVGDVFLDGRPLRRDAGNWAGLDEGNDSVSTGRVNAYQFVSPSTLRLRPVSDQETTLTVEMIYCPSVSARRFPDWLFDEWGHVLEAGIKYRLMSMAGARWFNPSTSTMYMREYSLGVADARIRRNRKGTNTCLRIQPRVI